MSTKMSTDMHLTRPSSRVIRPPGGASSLVFGNEDLPKPPAVVNSPPRPRVANSPQKTRPETATASTAATVATPVCPPKPPVKGKVAVIVAGVEGNYFIESTVKALAVEGAKDCVQSTIPDVTSLVYAAQTLGKNVDVVIAGGILNSAQAELATSLTNALLQAGLNGTPIVPALVVRPSLLEAKVHLADASRDWAQSACSILSLKSGAITTAAVPEVVIKEKPVLTPTVSSVDTLMDILRESLKARGASGIIGLSRKFRIVDDDNSGQLDLKEFTKAMTEHALGWTTAQIKSVFDFFDKDKSGSISLDEFIQGVRGQLNNRRKQLVLLAFDVLDADKSGVIELNDIMAKYSADKHPDVISHKRTKEEVLREFLDTFDGEEKDGKVTPQEFINYYANVSSSIDNDDYFELMIRNAWHISGGEGWCANSSCRRVLVVHTDGRQTVEEIKNDLGINGDDKNAILSKLREQGVTDIDYVELSNGVKHKATESASVPSTPGKPTSTASSQAAEPQQRTVGFNPRRQPGGASTFTLG